MNNKLIFLLMFSLSISICHLLCVKCKPQAILFSILKWQAYLCYLLFQTLLFRRVLLNACHLLPHLPASESLRASPCQPEVLPKSCKIKVLLLFMFVVNSMCRVWMRTPLFCLHSNQRSKHLEASRCHYPSVFCCKCLSGQRGSNLISPPPWCLLRVAYSNSIDDKKKVCKKLNLWRWGLRESCSQATLGLKNRIKPFKISRWGFDNPSGLNKSLMMI